MDVVSGEQALSQGNAESLKRVFDACIATGQPRLVFDCSQVPLVDSVGLELLLDTRDACRRRGGQFQLAGLNSLCTDILNATGLSSVFDMYDDAVTAAGSFAR